jgi:glutamyl-tRNA synthetase
MIQRLMYVRWVAHSGSLAATAVICRLAHRITAAKDQQRRPGVVAITGRTVGLPLFESVEVLGRPRTLTRIDAATTKLTLPG